MNELVLSTGTKVMWQSVKIGKRDRLDVHYPANTTDAEKLEACEKINVQLHGPSPEGEK